MKKFNLLFLIILTIFGLSILKVNAEGTTEIAGAKYKVDEVQESTVLPYGVKHTRVFGETATSMSGYDADGFGGATDLVVPGQFYPQQVNVLEVPSSSTVRVTTWANLHNNKWTLTTVRGMINDYETENPGWKVIAAINGDFFDIGGNGNLPYQTIGSTVSNGEFFKTSTGNLVGFRNDGSVDSIVGNEPVQRTDKMILSVYNENNEVISQFDIDKVNETPLDNETAIYFANYDSEHNLVPVNTTFGTSNGYVVGEADLALPNSANNFYGKGVISSTEDTTLGVGQFAISTNNPLLKAVLATGVTIRCQYEFVGNYANVTDVSGCGTTVMTNGEDNPAGGIGDRAPRTVIGRKTDGTIVMMVIDGRQSSKNMYGADRTELSAIMKSYDVVEAYNLDGGGSSTMVVREAGSFVVKNSPSDGTERTDANCILVVVKDPELNTSFTNVTGQSLTMNVEVTNTNNHDVKEVLVEMNNEMKTVTNGEVSFSNLEYNTQYPYTLYYKDSSGELVRLVSDGKALTYKHVPEFLGFEITETLDTFVIKVLYNDPDNAANFASNSIGINGKKTYLYQGVSTLKKKSIGNFITQLSINYTYDINDGVRVPVEVASPTIVYKYSVEVCLADLYIVQSNLLDGIYK